MSGLPTPVARLTSATRGRPHPFFRPADEKVRASLLGLSDTPDDTEFIDTLISEVIECPILEVFGRHREGYSRRDYTNAGQGADFRPL